MADSAVHATVPRNRPEKRDRLVAAAVRLFHQNGVERTRIAEIAALADVPPGNVYYYFKTKDDMIAAAIDAHAAQVSAVLARIDSEQRTPKGRLKALLRELASQSELIVESGCPLGSLCSELDKLSGSSLPVADPMNLILEWARDQFTALGRRDARALALDLLAAYEGHALLTNTLRDPSLLSAAVRRIGKWIDTI